MGCDFLDLTLQLEKKHGIYIMRSAIPALQEVQETGPHRFWSSGSDYRVGRFYQVLSAHAVRACDQSHGPPRTKNKWSLTATADCVSVSCPTCGRALARIELTWEDFRDTLATVVNIKSAKIQKETWLFKDLGFS